MKNFTALLALLALPLGVFAQLSLSGFVKDATDGQPLAGANLVLLNTSRATATDAQGHYQLDRLSPGSYTLRLTYVGYEPQTMQLNLTATSEFSFSMVKSTYVTDEVIVQATRVTDRSGMAYTNLNRQDIEKQNLGQDLPFLLNNTPSVVVNSDAGAGIGYTGIRIRGTDASRINVTVNGIPLNDAESHGVFWVNMPDFASSVDNIQIQRGVGTSTNGAGAFGASINIQTTTLEAEPYAEISSSYGSFNSLRNTVKAGTGLLNNRWAIDARLSKISSDGYIDRASSDLKSFFLSATYRGDKSLLKLNVFSGKEVTYQAWGGVPQSLLQTNRTFNPYTYDNEVDNYQQDHYQLHYSRELGYGLSLNAALHYTRGRGYFEQFRTNRRLSNFGLPNVVIGNATISRTDMVLRRWLDNDFGGATYSLNYSKNKLEATLGGGLNRYVGDHFGEVIWAQYASTGQIRHRYYNNRGNKNDFNIFGKTYYQITDRLNAFADLQYRHIAFDAAGTTNNQQEIDLDKRFNFFNPKAGLVYQFNPQQQVYASYSVANREPTRRNFTDAPTEKQPVHETLYNLEAGYRHQTSRYSLGVNYYHMNYRNQLIMTGEVNDVGAPIMINVPQSYRTGLELEGSYILAKQLRWHGNATYSINKIANYQETNLVYDVNYNVVGVTELAFKNTNISFSPSWVGASTLIYAPTKGLEAAFISKYVGSQYMDNTSNAASKLDAFFVNDFRVSYAFTIRGLKEARITLLAANIFNELYEPNGYTYTTLFQEGDVIRPEVSNFYYPQAGRNYMASVSLRF
jgi:iron complex outermembrane recepter protein